MSGDSALLLEHVRYFPFIAPNLFPIFTRTFPTCRLVGISFPAFKVPAAVTQANQFLVPHLQSLSVFSLRTSVVVSMVSFVPFLLHTSELAAWCPFFLGGTSRYSITLQSTESTLFVGVEQCLFFPDSSVSKFLLLDKVQTSADSVAESVDLVSSYVYHFTLIV